MTTHTDGARPSVSSGHDDGSGAEHGKKAEHRRQADETDDPNPLWLRQEIQRRVAAKGLGSGGRHARPEVAERSDLAETSELARSSQGAGISEVAGSDSGPPTTRLTALPAGSVRDGVDGTSSPRIHVGPPGPAPVRPIVFRPATPDQPAWYPPTDGSEPRRPDRPSDGEPNTDGSDGAPERVRVVLSERNRTARTVRTVEVVQESDGVGELLRNNLIGSQLAVALRFAVVAGATLGLLPVLFALFPAIGRTEVFGLRLPWLLLGVLVYPFLFGLGWWHTRTAERVEQNFVEYVRG